MIKAFVGALLAMLAFALPMKEMGPVWSAITPTLIGSEPWVGDGDIVFSLALSVSRATSSHAP